jgi:hypothetical protein
MLTDLKMFFQLVAALDQEDLNTMEISLPGHRKGLLTAAAQLK